MVKKVVIPFKFKPKQNTITIKGIEHNCGTELLVQIWLNHYGIKELHKCRKIEISKEGDITWVLNFEPYELSEEKTGEVIIIG